VRWLRTGGPEALDALNQSGAEITAADLPPTLGGAQPLWDLYQLLGLQWRIGPAGPVALDMNVFGPESARRGWDPDTALTLLAQIEDEERAHFPSPEG